MTHSPVLKIKYLWMIQWHEKMPLAKYNAAYLILIPFPGYLTLPWQPSRSKSVISTSRLRQGSVHLDYCQSPENWLVRKGCFWNLSNRIRQWDLPWIYAVASILPFPAMTTVCLCVRSYDTTKGDGTSFILHPEHSWPVWHI